MTRGGGVALLQLWTPLLELPFERSRCFLGGWGCRLERVELVDDIVSPRVDRTKD